MCGGGGKDDKLLDFCLSILSANWSVLKNADTGVGQKFWKILTKYLRTHQPIGQLGQCGNHITQREGVKNILRWGEGGGYLNLLVEGRKTLPPLKLQTRHVPPPEGVETRPRI